MRYAALLLFLCAALKGAGGPELLARNVLNFADRSGGKVAPGEIVVLFPSNAGPPVFTGAQLDGAGRVTTVLGDTRVLFDGIAAPMSYCVKGEVGAVVPYEIADRKTTEVVVEYQGVRSPPISLAVVDSKPALFTLDATGKGQAGMLNETGCCNSARNSAARGSIAVLYATGEGQTVPPGITGSVSAFDRVALYPVPKLPVQVTVGGLRAEIVYAASAPHAIAGLLQVNFRVPAKAPLGDAVPVVLSIGNSSSADGVTMAIRSPVQRILVVDPVLAARNRFKGVLARAGYEVLTARNGREALAEARLHGLDLAIFSMAMPRGERLETIRALRAERPQLKLVTTAGALGPATLRAADLLGAQAVLIRPIGSQALLRRVRELLQARPIPYVANPDPSASPFLAR